jgi:hypothetical protein
MKKINKKANILTENIIFIILNLIFLVILIFFVISKTSNAAVYEEKYAKQIALILDSAKPIMTIKLNVEDALKEKEKNFDINDMVSISGNIVTVKLREKGGYSYSFFNDVTINNPYFDSETSQYIFIIDSYNQKEVANDKNLENLENLEGENE